MTSVAGSAAYRQAPAALSLHPPVLRVAKSRVTDLLSLLALLSPVSPSMIDGFISTFWLRGVFAFPVDPSPVTTGTIVTIADASRVNPSDGPSSVELLSLLSLLSPPRKRTSVATSARNRASLSDIRAHSL